MAKHVFRVFVSSTFNELKEERITLQAWTLSDGAAADVSIVLLEWFN